MYMVCIIMFLYLLYIHLAYVFIGREKGERRMESCLPGLSIRHKTQGPMYNGQDLRL